MANEGGLITAAATLVAAFAFVLATRVTLPGRTGRETQAISAFFGLSALFLTLSGLRQIAAYAGAYDVDEVLFLILVVPAAVAVAPLARLAAAMLDAPKSIQRTLSGMFLVLVLGGLAFFYADGIRGPVLSYWGTEWEIVSPVARLILIVVVVLPAVLAGAIALYASRNLGDPHGPRLRRVGFAILVYYIVFTLDALALPGAFLIAERLLTAATAWFAYRAYARPVSLS